MRPSPSARCLLLVGLCGCDQLEPFLPTVAFDRVEVEAVSFTDIATDFVFAVDNPNPVEMQLASYSYALALEGVPLLEGTQRDGLALEARGRSELGLPVDLVFADLWNTIEATRGEDVVGFTLDGHFGFDTPAGVARLPYDADGGFPALRTPRITLDGLRVVELGLLGAELALDVGVDNAHGSTLFFDDFAYGIALEGQELASGDLTSFEVEGADKARVSLPIRLDLVAIGEGIGRAVVNGGPVDVGLVASVDVDTPFGVIPLDIAETADLRVK